MSLSQATTAYDVIRLDLLEKESKAFILRVNDFVDRVKLAVISSNGSNNSAEEAMQQALAFLSQETPHLSGDETTADGEKWLSMKKLHEDMEEMRIDIESLKQKRDELKLDVSCLLNVAEDEKEKLAYQRQRHEKLASQFKQHKLSQRMAMHIVEKNLTKTRDFIKRCSQHFQVQQVHAATASNSLKPNHLFKRDTKQDSSASLYPHGSSIHSPLPTGKPFSRSSDKRTSLTSDNPRKSIGHMVNFDGKTCSQKQATANQNDISRETDDIIASALGSAIGSSLRHYFLQKK